MRVVVAGAGALGGWLSLFLLQEGFEVILLDGHGTGNARSSSGDETRVIRTVYKDEIYTRFTLRSQQIWLEHEKNCHEKFLYPIGVLNLIGRDEQRWLVAQKNLNQYSVGYKYLETRELTRQFPAISVEGLRYGILENGGGYLKARRGCESVVERFVALGGNYQRQFLKPLVSKPGTIEAVSTLAGDLIDADVFVLAGGPWLGQMMPGMLDQYISPSRQELYYFGVPAASVQAMLQVPVWCDFSSLDDDVMYYGIPARDTGGEGFGFKIGEDVAGPAFDPELGDRNIGTASLARAREFMYKRFPLMAGAPLLQSRVCQYENTADAHLLADLIPGYQNLWVLGGGSGHGYKLGAAMGEYLAKRIAGNTIKEKLLSFNRFQNPVDGDIRR